MERFRLVSLVALLVVCMAVPLAADIGKRGGDRQILGVYPDPASNFDMPEMYNVFLLDTVAVPIYLNTTRSVTYIENRITWTQSQLTFVTVTKGPALPGSATLTWTALNAYTVKTMISNADSFPIASGSPIAYLKVRLQCFGWATTAPLSFVNDDNYNFYIASGLPYAPVRRTGGIQSVQEYFAGFIGKHIDVFAGEQHITLPYDYYQQIRAKLRKVRVLFDSSVLRFDSVDPGPCLNGGTVTGTANGDTIKLEFPPSNPWCLTDSQTPAFYLHLGLKNGTDNYSTQLNVIYAERIDVCGWVTYPSMNYQAQITVPNHTALADLGNISCYNTALYYDLPFIMDSNMPVNAYKFYVRFPSSQLRFDQVVGVGGFAVPAGVRDQNDTSLVDISNGYGTNYHPDNLPATVFYLRFYPRTAPPVGTVFNFTFEGTPDTEVRYLMDQYGYHTADLTTYPGSITIVQYHHPHGCPTLYVWDGSSFEKDNTILAACAGAKVTSDVTDYYLVSKPVAQNDTKLRFQIREDGSQVSEFRDFKLMMVQHPANKPVQVTKDGRLITVGQPYAITWAHDSKGNDITNLIAAKDEVAYSSSQGGWFDVSFGKLTKEQITDFALSESRPPKDDPENLRASGAPDVDKRLKISMRTADGAWKLVSEEDPRLEPDRMATAIDPKLIDPEQELVLRYSWEGSYRVDLVEFNSVAPYQGKVYEPRLVSAVHSKDGAVTDALGMSDPGDVVTLSHGESIDLTFDLGSSILSSNKMQRTYVFVATGKYETPGESAPLPSAFSLKANSPNPFNPTTTIRYSLPVPASVEIKIYDARGALVRTLVSGMQTAGEKAVTWDGRSDSGMQASSGVYFCSMTAPGFNQSRKMILLR